MSIDYSKHIGRRIKLKTNNVMGCLGVVGSIGEITAFNPKFLNGPVLYFRIYDCECHTITDSQGSNACNGIYTHGIDIWFDWVDEPEITQPQCVCEIFVLMRMGCPSNKGMKCRSME